MGEKHKGLADSLESPLSHLVEHNRQGKGEHGCKNQKEKIQIEGVTDNHSGGVASKEKLKILKSDKGTAKDPLTVIEALKGYDDIRIGTVPVYKSIENSRQQQQIPVGMDYDIVNKPFLFLPHI
jgi:hypothetical protein